MKLEFTLLLLCVWATFTDAETCENKQSNEYCDYWKGQGYCEKDSDYRTFMEGSCKKSCGLCPDCINSVQYSSVCASWKGVGYCSKNSKYYEFMSQHCRLECGICTATAPVCGKGLILGERVVGGVNADPGSWPWQASLKIDGVLTCGGTLIAKKWVLTAGHCLIKAGNLVTEGQLEIILGDHDRNKVDRTEQTFKVLRIVRHPNYNPATKDTDIALLEMNEEATLNNYVGLACLPTEEPKIKWGSTCYISGFGKTGDEAPQAVILQQARLPVVTNSECSILNKHPPVTSNMLCAGYGLDFSHTESGCRGDSGGPFVCEKNGAWYVQGVVSWGSSRCISGENFTVFTRVLNFVQWIKATIG